MERLFVLWQMTLIRIQILQGKNLNTLRYDSLPPKEDCYFWKNFIYYHNNLERFLRIRYIYPPFLLQIRNLPTNLPIIWLT